MTKELTKREGAKGRNRFLLRERRPHANQRNKKREKRRWGRNHRFPSPSSRSGAQATAAVLSVLTLAARRRLPSGLAAPCRGSTASWGVRAKCPTSDEGHTATAEGRHQTASSCRLAEIDFLIKKNLRSYSPTYFLFIYLFIY